MPTILFAEDEEVLGLLVKEALDQEPDFRVTWVRNGIAAMESFKAARPDICVLDIMMPLMDGYSLAARIREQEERIPIIFLTARSQTADVLKGFDAGGNDYLKKPFSIEELAARIRALLRYSHNQTQASCRSRQVLPIGKYRFFPAAQELRYAETKYNLTHRESELLKELAIRPNQILLRSEALQQLWGDDNFFNARTMDVYIVKLRKYLAHDDSLAIINVRKQGYKLTIKE